MNLVILSGNVGGEPNVRTFDDGSKAVDFSLATTKRGFTTRDGREIPERTIWHRITCKGSLAEFASKYVQKGKKYLVTGEISEREYERDGVKHKVVEIAANAVEFCEPANTTQSTGNAPTAQTNAKSAPLSPQMQEAIRIVQSKGNFEVAGGDDDEPPF